ncbi:sporulation protein [Bacillus lacus]|uniref:Sporulation protein n=1 Tax=Metabacillus lacus TaxID=1983721 RepID=A0A7X2IZ01_9BACI|nr:YtrH family sporulation protein [Metabacillus lacus]MRX71743.1 sporulation protein [Metabacillus lacus]
MDMKEAFMPAFINSYFIALGVLLGGTIIGGIGAYLAGEPPFQEMHRLSNVLKIWALVAAIGGTFDTFNSFERGIFEGATRDAVKQVFLIVSAMGGSQTGWLIISWLTQEQVNS